MKELLSRWLLLTLAIIFAAWIFHGFYVSGLPSALVAAGILGLLNTFLMPVSSFLTGPVSIVLFGLFMLLVNALAIELGSAFLPGFRVSGIGTALMGALVICLVDWVFTPLLHDRWKPHQVRRKTDRPTAFFVSMIAALKQVLSTGARRRPEGDPDSADAGPSSADHSDPAACGPSDAAVPAELPASSESSPCSGSEKRGPGAAF